MNRQRWLALVFAAVALVQIALPAHRIWQYEQTLRAGKPFKFRTAPVDPYDAFRGRYVALQFEANEATWTGGGAPPPHGTKIWTRVEQGDNGFARFHGIFLEKPTEGDFLAAHVAYGGSDGRVTLKLPFERFYMEEHLAPKADRVYAGGSRTNQAGTENAAYALVRIREGLGVIEQVFIGEQTLAQAASVMD